MVKLVPIGLTEATQHKRLGFLEGVFKVPDDFDRMGREEIASLFNGPA